MASGSGPDMCVGLHLARLEMNAIFSALATRVKRFHIQQQVRNLNNVLRGFRQIHCFRRIGMHSFVDARTPAVPIYFPITFRSASLILSCQPGPAS